MTRGICLYSEVNIDFFMDIIANFEACGKRRDCVEVCMKDTLIKLMELAKDHHNIRLVENALRITIAEYKYQTESRGMNFSGLSAQEKARVIDVLKYEYEN